MTLAQDTPLYTAAQIRACEQDAISHRGISADELMTRAGTAALLALRRFFPAARRLAIFCGGGNNGGDGYVLARLAQEKGYSVNVYQYKSPENLPEPARHAALLTLAAGVPCQYLDEPLEDEVDVIVDALTGIGLQGVITEPLTTVINQINESDIPVFALDIPSGLHSDSGRIMGVCVKAAATITFIARKLGMMTAEGPDYCGDIVLDDLQLPLNQNQMTPAARLLDDRLLQTLKKRPRNSHKGHFGHVLAVGGGLGMPGAIALAAKAALRVGAGLVTVATRPEYAQGLCHFLPEAMVSGVNHSEQLLPLLEKATVCLIGPGLGEEEWAWELFNVVMTSQLPMVIDAHALHCLASDPQYDDNWILTPHPGEAALLLQCTTADIQQDRLQAITTLQQRYGGNIVLKGVGSLIQTDQAETWVCGAGNPGMASAGMGDVLSGVLAGLVAQKLALSKATKLGVYVHARAGDIAAQLHGERGTLASDLLPYLHQLVNPKEVR